MSKLRALFCLGLAFAFGSAAGCAKTLDELEPYPCASDGSCPDGRTCNAAMLCTKAHVDSLCKAGQTDCSTAAPGATCTLGVCGQLCDGNRITCPNDRVCTVARGAGGSGACLKGCAEDADCPEQLVCRRLDVRDGEVVKACISPTSASVIGAHCTADEDCTRQGASLVCFANVCTQRCKSSADCGEGSVCPAGGGGCLQDCSSDAQVCENDQECVPVWAGSERGCVGKGQSLPACGSVKPLFLCNGLCGTSRNDVVCANDSAATCPADATCVEGGKCRCPSARACSEDRLTAGRKCTEQAPCLDEPWWCEPSLTNVGCDTDVSRMMAYCNCRDGRMLLSMCGSQGTCEARCQDECDVVRQDCLDPRTPKCAVVSLANGTFNRCVALAKQPRQEHESCHRDDPQKPGLDDCDRGLFCSLVRDVPGKPQELECRRQCDEARACGPDEVCASGLDSVSPNLNDSLCRPRCTFPNDDECGSGARCTLGGACIADSGIGKLDDVCFAASGCAPPYVCELVTSRCLPVCQGPEKSCPAGYECRVPGTDDELGAGGAGAEPASSSRLCFKQ